MEEKKGEREAFCWVKFMKGWINHKFLAFVITTLLVHRVIFSPAIPLSDTAMITLFIVWGVAVLAFIFGKSLDTAVENMQISAELKAGASVNKDIRTEGKE